jgi:hypothetical protein
MATRQETNSEMRARILASGTNAADRRRLGELRDRVQTAPGEIASDIFFMTTIIEAQDRALRERRNAKSQVIALVDEGYEAEDDDILVFLALHDADPEQAVILDLLTRGREALAEFAAKFERWLAQHPDRRERLAAFPEEYAALGEPAAAAPSA